MQVHLVIPGLSCPCDVAHSTNGFHAYSREESRVELGLSLQCFERTSLAFAKQKQIHAALNCKASEKWGGGTRPIQSELLTLLAHNAERKCSSNFINSHHFLKDSTYFLNVLCFCSSDSLLHHSFHTSTKPSLCYLRSSVNKLPTPQLTTAKVLLHPNHSCLKVDESSRPASLNCLWRKRKDG